MIEVVVGILSPTESFVHEKEFKEGEMVCRIGGKLATYIGSVKQ